MKKRPEKSLKICGNLEEIKISGPGIGYFSVWFIFHPIEVTICC
jgi:hypothetical protein